LKELLDLGDPRVDADDRSRPLGEQVVSEAAAAIHLDEQPAEVAEHVLTRPKQGAALTSEHASMGAPRSDALVPSAPAKER
jgi:hypothetical protein